MTQSQAFWLQVTAIISVLFSPVIAVLVTLWYQNRKEKRLAKLNLFLTLFAYRGLTTNPNRLTSLNSIEVVFHRHHKVILAWHKLFESLHQRDLVNVDVTWRILHLDLLSEMAQTLGYQKIKVIDMEKYYSPQVVADQEMEDREMRRQLLEYLKTNVAVSQRMLQTETDK